MGFGPGEKNTNVCDFPARCCRYYYKVVIVLYGKIVMVIVREGKLLAGFLV